MKIKNMKIYNTIQNSGTVMHFLDQNLKIKNGEQLKHRNIMNEILWIYGRALENNVMVTLHVEPPPNISGVSATAFRTRGGGTCDNLGGPKIKWESWDCG